jgi:hypothetical protein
MRLDRDRAIGIDEVRIVAGKDADGHGYVLADQSASRAIDDFII